MTAHRTATWGLGLALGACSVPVDDSSSGLSAGMSGPGSGMTATDADGSGGETVAPTSSPTTDSGGTTAGADGTGPAETGPDGTSSDGTGPAPQDTGDSSDDGMTGSDTTSGESGAPGDPLDPGLDVPEGGLVCDTPGSLTECPGGEVCRFHTTEQSLCESCVGCGNLGAPCVEGPDCDILFACYQGECTNICPLGTFFCGPIEDCLDVGHPTHGVCAPF